MSDAARHETGWREAFGEQAGWDEDQDEDYGAQDEEGFLPGLGSSHGDGGSAPRPGRRRRRGRWIAPLIAFVVIIGLLGGVGIYGYRAYHNKHADYVGAGTGSVTVQVLPGQGAATLAPTLVKLGVIEAVAPFTAAAEASKATAGLQPGYFRLHKHMSAALAYQMLINPASRIQTTVTIPEGLRAVNIVSVLGSKSGLSKNAFARALADTAALGLPSYAGGHPEGYLFPATYTIVPHESALSVLQAMVKSYNAAAASVDLPAVARHDDFTPAQIVVEASLIQAEGGRLADFPKIARVIDNRLQAGMKLQFDSTVFYGLHTYGTRATSQQILSKSPYNTYRYTDLPPGPIDSPGLAAIQAALHPAAGNWLYFVTVDLKTGLTKFTNSFAQEQLWSSEIKG